MGRSWDHDDCGWGRRGWLCPGAGRGHGYLNSYFQDPDQPKQPWSDLGWGHELYNLGHLIQAAVAATCRLGDGRLLTIAGRFADLVVRTFGVDGEEVVDGHPEIEMALVELIEKPGTRTT